jgi:hypothetical protein
MHDLVTWRVTLVEQELIALPDRSSWVHSKFFVGFVLILCFLCTHHNSVLFTHENCELIIVPNQMWIVSCNHWFQHRTQQKCVTNLETITNPWGPWVVARGTTQHPATSRIVSNSLLPCVFTQRGFSNEYSSIDQQTFTAKSSGLSMMNATVKESLSILNWINQSKQLFHIDVRLA